MTAEKEAPQHAAELRRKRLSYQSWHRGIREMDLILGRFTEKHMSGLSDEDVAELERLFEVADTTLYQWLCGRAAVPAEHDTVLFQRLKAWAATSTHS